MVVAILHFVHELYASLHWLIPVSAAITTAIIRQFPVPFHSTPDNSKTYVSTKSSPQSNLHAPSLSGVRLGKDEMTMPSDHNKPDLNGPSKIPVRGGYIFQPQPLQEARSSFMNLPVEIRLSIFRHCAPIPAERQGPNSMDTFLTLLRVSKTIQREAYMGCLPYIPLALWSKKGVRSFRMLLLKKPELGCYVRYLWIGTGKLDDEELGWAMDVVKGVTRLKSIACGEYVLAKAVNGGLLAKTCERVTLMGVERGIEYEAWGVKQVRLSTGMYSTKERFPDLTTLCFNARRANVKDDRVKEEYEVVDRWVNNVEKFVLVERDLRRVSARGLEMKFKVGRRGSRPGMFSVTLPGMWTEWDIWSSDVVGAGVWDVCGIA